MGDGPATGHLGGGALGIDVDPLMVAGDFGEGVDHRLVDGQPVADPEFGSDMLEQVVRMAQFHTRILRLTGFAPVCIMNARACRRVTVIAYRQPHPQRGSHE